MAELNPRISPANPHVQSILGSSRLRMFRLFRGNPVEREKKEVILKTPHGTLQGYYTDGVSEKLTILLHGWLGCAQSIYIQLLADRLYREGHSIFRLNFRDHGDSLHLNEELFHSCRLDEVVAAIRMITNKYQHPRKFLAGFSLGGNFALRVTSRAAENNISLERVFSVSPAISPRESMAAINSHPIYLNYFRHRWHQNLKAKSRIFPHLFINPVWEKEKSLTKLTEDLLLKFTDFETIDDYFQGYTITPEIINNISTPTTVILAEDDPVTPYSEIFENENPESLKTIKLKNGGHCGFVQGLSMRSWIEDYLSAKTV